MDNAIRFKGEFLAECFNPDGSLAWSAPLKFPNAPSNSGLNDILSVYFGGGTQKALWYMALIDSTGFSGLAAADSMSSHSGWSESTAFSESTRPAWTPGSPAGQAITNPTATAFTMNATATIKGACIVSNSTKGGTSGQLWATGLFASPQVMSSGQILRVTYTCTASGS